MSNQIRRFILAGPANAIKTEIAIRNLVKNPIIQSKIFIFLCECDLGCAVNAAKEFGIEVFITKDPRFKTEKAINDLKLLSADILVCCGWNYIVPPCVINLFPYTPINCHSSLLPDYKGQRAYMHQWANLEEKYGVTIHYINDKLDDGKIVLQGELKLFHKENIKIMHQRISEVTAFLLPQALLMVESGYQGLAYNNDVASRYFYKISPFRAKLHRFCNLILKTFKVSLWITSHK